MATVTHNSGTTKNLDEITGYVQSADTLVTDISGSGALSPLVINSEPQWGKKASPLYQIQVKAGELKIDARDTRWFAYNNGAGAYPNISLGANLRDGENNILGEVIGIWTTFPGNPTVYGSVGAGTTPAVTGWIKVRSLPVRSITNGENLNIYDTVNTMTLTAAENSKLGWLAIISLDYWSGTFRMMPRGSIAMYGDWWELGTSNGAANQTFNHYTLDGVPAVWVEKYAGADVALGDVGYEIWVNCGTYVQAKYKTAGFGKVFSQSGGVLTFGSSANGHEIPANGCKLRVPNLHFNTTNTTAWATMTRSVQATDYNNSAVYANGGEGRHQKMIAHRVIGDAFTFQANRCGTDFRDVAVNINFRMDSCEGDVYMLRTGVGQHTTQNFNPLHVTGSRADSFLLEDCTFLAGGNSSPGSRFESALTPATFRRCKFIGGRASGYSTAFRALYVYISNYTTWEDCWVVGGDWYFGTCHNTLVKNPTLGDTVDGTATVANGKHIQFVTSRSCVVDGLNKRGAFAALQSNVYGIIHSHTRTTLVVKNLGSWGSLIDCNARTLPVTCYDNSHVEMYRCYWTNTAGFKFTDRIVPNSSQIKMFNCYDGVQVGFSPGWMNTKIRGVYMTYINGTIFDWGGSSGRFNAIVQNPGFQPLDMFYSWTQGAVMFPASPPSSENPTYTLSSGALYNTGTGYVHLLNAGEYVEWEMPYYVLGHKQLAASNPEIGGGSIANLLVQYQLDTGSGFSGTWKTANAANLGGEPGNLQGGFRLKCRVSYVPTHNNATVSYVAFLTITDQATMQSSASLYPMGQCIGTFNGVEAGSEIRIYDENDVELAGVENCFASPTLSWPIPSNPVVKVTVIKRGRQWRKFTVTSIDGALTIPVFQPVDRGYNNPA